ncbi:MAG: CaiB/BaiF CoA transferase family protein [Acidimicrobiia bacterium]
MSRAICDQLTVLELGSGSIAGSFAGMLLADNGARVLKIEPPEGDRLRTERPTGFLVWNRGKDSLVVDLRTPDGQARLRELALQADVVIEAFRTGVAEAWGIGSDTLLAANPALVYCSVKGFGTTGGYADIPGYEGIVAAKTGHWVSGGWGFRDGPIYNDAPMASTACGHEAAGGILAALVARERSGKGQRVDARLVQGLVPYDYFGVATAQHIAKMSGGATTSRTSGSPAVIMQASRMSFTAPTKDGRWINFTHMMPRQAQALSKALGIADCIDDPRFATQPYFDSADNAQGWEDLVWDALRTKTYAEWEPILLADDNIAFEMARRSIEGLDHAQIKHNGNAIVVSDPKLGPVREVGPVAAFRDAPARIERSAPELGAAGEPFVRRSPAPAGHGDTPKAPLEGFTVIELGYFYAMPYGSTMAASMGARVIKLEGLTGDPMRNSFGFPETGGAKTMEGKESLSIDLSKPEAQAIIYELAKNADVFIDGFRPGAAGRMNLGPEDLWKVNPDIEVIQAAGYGSSGPYAHRPIYAGVASALVGQVDRHAGTWTDPELTMSLSNSEAQIIVLPRLRGPVDGDANAAVAVFSTMMLAAYGNRAGVSPKLTTTSMIGGNAMGYADDFLDYEGRPMLPKPDSEGYGINALYRVYEAASGWVFVAAAKQKEFASLAAVVGRPDLVNDARFATVEARAANDDALIAELSSAFKAKNGADWEALCIPQGIAVVEAADAPISNFTITDPVIRATGLAVEVEHPKFGTMLRHGPVVEFSDTPAIAKPGVLCGQHTVAILKELGYDDARIAQLKADGVVSYPD